MINWYWLGACTFCAVIGFLAGFYECKTQVENKQRKEAFRIAIKNTIV